MRRFLTITAAVIFSISYSYANDLILSLERSGNSGDFISGVSVQKQEIENKNSPAALDLISSVTGVFVTKAASQIKSDVNIRGIGDSFRKIGMFIDGRPEKMSVYGCGVSQTLLSGNIERVEVTKGPDSVLYGGDALGGAVNIFTRKPVKPLEAEVSVSYGSYNTQNYFANLGGASDRLTYLFSVNKASSDGHLKNSGYDAADYYGKFGYRIDDRSEIIAGGKYFAGEEFEPRARNIAGGTMLPTDYSFKRGGADIKYIRDFNNGGMEILAFGDWGEHEFSDGFHSKDSLYGVFAHFTNTALENNTLKYGAEYRLADGKVITGATPAAPTGEWKKSEFAVFALDEYSINLKTKVFAGIRYNYDEKSGNNFVPRAGLSYDITGKFTARAVYSRGFRSPYMNELYTLPISNEDLEAETLNNYEIGFNSRYLGINFDASGFVMNGDNIIQVDTGRFRNSGSYVFKGAEVSAEGEILTGLKGYAGYSYLDPGGLTQGIVKNKIDLSLDYKIGRFTIYAGGMAVFDYYAANNGGTQLDDFNVFNAKIHYNVTDGLTFFAAADNFTDQKYEMFIISFGSARIYEMPGASFTFGAKYKF